MGLGLNQGMTLGGSSDAPVDFYIDSVNGSDANDGAATDSAKQTISSITLSDGLRIALARGSYWREQFGTDLDPTVNIRVEAYGTGPLPTLDGADVASSGGWSVNGTHSEVFERTWTHVAAAGQYVSLWEDGERLRWVADLTTCAATPGSFYVPLTTGAGSSLVQYHPTGTTDPGTNGFVVEISTRNYGIVAGYNTSGWRIEDIAARRSLSNNGSIVAYGPSSVIRRCLAEDGTKHNLFIGEDCLAQDCIAWKCDWADRTNSSSFVGYTNDGRGHSATFQRCVSVMELDKITAALAGAKGIQGFLAHTQGASTKWDEINIDDCSSYGCTLGASAGDCEQLNINRFKATEADRAASSSAVNATINDLYGIEGATVPMLSIYEHAVGSVTLDGVRGYVNSATTRGDVFNNISTVKVIVQNSVFVHSGTASRFCINGNSTSTDMESFNNIHSGSTNMMALRAHGAVDADYNVYYPSTVNFQFAPGPGYSDFPTYQAAESTDQNSVSADPLLVDPANGDFGVAEGSPATALAAGLLRPDVTYTAFPTDVALEAMRSIT